MNNAELDAGAAAIVSADNDTEAEPAPTGDIVCGNIHKDEYRQFWLNATSEDPYVRSIIEQGYQLQFEREPDAYQEPNNASALKNWDFVRASVKDMEAVGVVTKVDKAHCISPLTVAERINPDGSKKLRLCWDGSRMVNPCLKKEHVKFADLQKAATMVEENEYMFVYDLSKCFYHVRLHPDSKKYVAFEVDSQIYQFEVVCFGLAPATAVITRVTRPISTLIRKAGIRHSMYIDDGRGGANTKAEAIKAMHYVYNILKKAGFVLAADKSDSDEDVAQVKKYLGMEIDSTSMCIRVPDAKLNEIKDVIVQSLGTRQSAKSKAKVTGKVIAAEPGLGKIVHLLTKSAQADIAAVTNSHPWSWKMCWSEQSEEELLLLVRSMDEFNGHPIQARHKQVRLIDRINQSHSVAVSDASATGICAYSLKGDFSFFLHGDLTGDELRASSGERELCAVQKGLRMLQGRGYAQRSNFDQLLWVTDSTNMVSFLTKGSMKKHIQERIFDVVKTAFSMKIVINPVHLNRNDPLIQLADAGSREGDKDSWSVDEKTFITIERKLGATDIDLFADCYNTKKRNFASLFDYGGPTLVDAFTTSWDKQAIGRIYVCPPINLIIQSVRKIELEAAEGVLLVPAWPSGQFWPFLYPQGRINKRFTTCLPIKAKVKAREWARPYMNGEKDFIAFKFE